MKILTGNDLRSGAVTWWNGTGWHVRPAHIKDRVRALGPTVRRDLAVPTADKTGWDWVI
jgi:hypothetical protein